MINRQELLNQLLEKLKTANTENCSDIDLVLTYLENYISDPKIGGGSSKLLEFEIKPQIESLSTLYKITWKKLLNPRISRI
jgi:hypothetical protein